MQVNLGRVIGRSAYEEAVRQGYLGSEMDWLDTLKGKDAYQIACDYGYKGSKEEWLESFNGKSAYTYAKEGGFKGTEAEFAASIATIGDLNTLLDIVNGEVV